MKRKSKLLKKKKICIYLQTMRESEKGKIRERMCVCMYVGEQVSCVSHKEREMEKYK